MIPLLFFIIIWVLALTTIVLVFKLFFLGGRGTTIVFVFKLFFIGGRGTTIVFVFKLFFLGGRGFSSSQS